VRSLLAAFGFLTVLPLPASWRGGEPELGRSATYFPLVGLVIGIGAAALDAGLARLVPVGVASVLVVIALLAISGGLHVDGLADTADGFLSSRPRERILEIMKDSRSGPMGVAAVVCVLALKIAALQAIPRPARIGALVLAPVAGRSAMVLVQGVLRYARSAGTGLAFSRRKPWLGVAASLAVSVAVGFFLSGWVGLAACAGCLAVTAAMAGWSQRTIGGYTGDTLGATCEVVEIVPLLAAAAFAYGGAR
jgi:adenosylcobinamide-GDP ribazoletransferase